MTKRKLQKEEEIYKKDEKMTLTSFTREYMIDATAYDPIQTVSSKKNKQQIGSNWPKEDST